MHSIVLALVLAGYLKTPFPLPGATSKSFG